MIWSELEPIESNCLRRDSRQKQWLSVEDPSQPWNQAESVLTPPSLHSPTSLWCSLLLAEATQKPEGKGTPRGFPTQESQGYKDGSQCSHSLLSVTASSTSSMASVLHSPNPSGSSLPLLPDSHRPSQGFHHSGACPIWDASLLVPWPLFPQSSSLPPPTPSAFHSHSPT